MRKKAKCSYHSTSIISLLIKIKAPPPCQKKRIWDVFLFFFSPFLSPTINSPLFFILIFLSSGPSVQRMRMFGVRVSKICLKEKFRSHARVWRTEQNKTKEKRDELLICIFYAYFLGPLHTKKKDILTGL